MATRPAHRLHRKNPSPVYVRNKIKEITPYLDKVCKVHGANHPELHQIKALFMESAEDLTQHLYKEEIILFPHPTHVRVSWQQRTVHLEALTTQFT